MAAQGGSSECVTSLLSSGADPNLQDQLQQTPLFLTVVQGHAECVQLVSQNKHLYWSAIMHTHSKHFGSKKLSVLSIWQGLLVIFTSRCVCNTATEVSAWAIIIVRVVDLA